MKQKITANMEIKRANRANVYSLLFRRGQLTRQEIVESLQLSLPTVTQYLSDLQDEGLVSESGYIGNTGGRSAKTYDIVSDARTAIGLDITKNHISAVAVDLRGEITARIRVRYAFARTDAYYQYLGEIVLELITEAKLNPAGILGVGIGVPGLCTADYQTVYYGQILGFTGATCKEFSKNISYPTALMNDASAANFAELWINKGIKNAFYIMLSNNVGGSVVINGQLFNGDNLHSGEVGHLTIVTGGELCYCGKRGCMDPYCAATILSSLTDSNLEDFFTILKKGSPEAAELWDAYLDHLTDAVVNVHVLYDCKVIIGGYVGQFISDYMDDLKARISKFNIFGDKDDFIVVCSYQKEAIAAGAALTFISDFIKTI
ncbi:MAG: ROK family transcriptional regulator [Eubacteriales bacterium]